MSDCSKYSLNGVYRCENFAERLAQNTFPTVQIGTAGGISGWYMVLKTGVVGEEAIIYPVTNCPNEPRLLIHYFFNILGKDGKSFRWTSPETSGLYAIKMNISDVLNETNGYLDNGALVIEYGLHVMSVMGNDWVWRFNLNDAFFDPGENITMEYGDPANGPPKVLYGHRQLLRFHSPLFQSQVNKFIPRWTERLIEGCLQIAHGVRIPLDEELLKISLIAHHSKLRNVVQYVDQQLVEVYWHPEIKPSDVLKSSDILLVKNCIEFGLRHFLARLVNPFECLEDLKNMIQKLDIEKISGEAMKTFVTKIFKLKS